MSVIELSSDSSAPASPEKPQNLDDTDFGFTNDIQSIIDRYKNISQTSTSTSKSCDNTSDEDIKNFSLLKSSEFTSEDSTTKLSDPIKFEIGKHEKKTDTFELSDDNCDDLLMDNKEEKYDIKTVSDSFLSSEFKIVDSVEGNDYVCKDTLSANTNSKFPATSIKTKNPCLHTVTKHNVNAISDTSSDSDAPAHSEQNKENINSKILTASAEAQDLFTRLQVMTKQNINAISDSSSDSDSPIKAVGKRKCPKNSQSKLSKDEERQRKQEEREKRKEEAAREKALKQALKEENKNLKPDECMKFINVNIDNSLISSHYGAQIISALQAADIMFHVVPQSTANTITWTRKIQKRVINDNGQVAFSADKEEEDAILLIMLWNEVVDLINRNQLSLKIGSLKSQLGKKIYLGIFGLGGYFRYQKSVKHKEVLTQITEKKGRANKYDRLYKDAPKISRVQLETSLMELQLVHECSNRMLETPQDVGAMVAQFTKSIAQAPYKLEKNKKQQQTEWYASGDNRDCVRVDKNGNGTLRLWQQQLTQFPLASLETAEAICSKYASPYSLMKAYDQCSSQREAELLLQDIPIRRAAGPLTSYRKIGPELSKKLYTFFNSIDSNAFL